MRIVRPAVSPAKVTASRILKAAPGNLK